MIKVYKLLFTGLFFLSVNVSLLAQKRFFTDAGENATRPTTGQRLIIPDKFRTSTTDVVAMKSFLWSLPSEKDVMNRNLAPVMELPMPDGKMARFRVWESSLMAPALAAKFPEMRTFAGQGIDDPYATVRFDYNPYFGFRAQILSPVSGRIFIDPYARFDVNTYISYRTKDHPMQQQFACETPGSVNRTEAVNAGPCRGTQLFTYRLALACTPEYASAVSGGSPTVPVVAAEMLNAVNRVSGVYETEIAVRLTLVANNDNLIFLSGGPYSNNNGGAMLAQNQATCDLTIGPGNYDIGHVFSTGGGGIAGLGVVCVNGFKARGVTGLPNPVGDPFYIDFVAHEMGHQFGGNHTFNGQSGNCGGARNGSTAYEVGSGTTIQAYAGICGGDNIQPNSDPFFHSISFDEIGNDIASKTCHTASATGNTLPVITSMSTNGASIPIGTPFTLNATATDANGDALTYCWEQWDLGPQGTWNSGASSTTAPLFRSRVPTTTGSRTFPDIRVIAANFPANPPSQMDGLKGETLAQVARPIKFRLTVRDNRAGGGGVVTGGDGCQTGFTDFFQVNVVATSGPFAVTAPNGGENYPGGSVQTITWNPVGTETAPFNAANVRISLSTDGGLTYPIEITASTPNDGSEALSIPGVTTTTARVKIEAIGNIFFDISNANFTIAAPAAGFSFNNPAPVSAACPTSGSMQTTLTASYFGGFTTDIALSASGNPGGTTVSFGTNPLTFSNTSTTVTLNNTNTLTPGSYVVTVTGTAGAIVQTRDITFNITAGAGPAITAQPGNQTVCAGANASFSITAATATSFQWQISTNGGGSFANLPNGAPYSGATTNTLTITGATAGLNGNQYRCIASTLCGSSTSTAGVLTVNTAPAITTQPQSVTLCAGGNNTFTVVATGAGLTYQWRKDGNPLANGGNISGATSASLTVSTIAIGDAGTYDVVVSGTCPSPATSAGATLTVVTSVTITTQPTNQTACAGGNATFTAAASGGGAIFQWQLNTGSGFANVPAAAPYTGGTTATLTITGVTAGMNGYQYRVLVSNATCTTPATSNTASLTVNTLPAISANPQTQTLCTGSSVTFNVTATGTGITYQWRKGGVNLSNGGNISGATSAALTINNLVAGDAGNYDVVVTGTCPPAATSATAVLTVIAPVLIATQPVNTETCSGSNASFTVVGSGTSILYQWQVNPGSGFVNVPVGAPYTGGTTSTLTINAAAVGLNGYQYRALVSNSTCPTPAASSPAILTVRQLPTVGLTASPTTSLLPGQSTTLTATPTSSTGGTLSTSWFFNGTGITNAGNTRTVTVEEVGSYQVTIRETWPSTLVCSNQSLVVIIDAPSSNRLFIFPSPNDGSFTVSYYNASGAATSRTITIFDSKGARMYNRSFAVAGPYTLIPVDIRPAQKGMYFVIIGDANGKKLAEGKVVINQ